MKSKNKSDREDFNKIQTKNTDIYQIKRFPLDRTEKNLDKRIFLFGVDFNQLCENTSCRFTKILLDNEESKRFYPL